MRDLTTAQSFAVELSHNLGAFCLQGGDLVCEHEVLDREVLEASFAFCE